MPRIVINVQVWESLGTLCAGLLHKLGELELADVNETADPARFFRDVHAAVLEIVNAYPFPQQLRGRGRYPFVNLIEFHTRAQALEFTP